MNIEWLYFNMLILSAPSSKSTWKKCHSNNAVQNTSLLEGYKEDQWSQLFLGKTIVDNCLNSAEENLHWQQWQVVLSFGIRQ